jgi:hypothetical protein
MRTRITERELSRITSRIINEIEEDGMNGETMSGDINRVMDFAYEMITELAPDGPRNRRQYMAAINQLESDFNYSIRNLKGNLGMGE